jgi:hypothetical protein
MEGLTSPAKEVSTGSESTIHRSAWNKNSANFALWGFSAVQIHDSGYLSPSGRGCGSFCPIYGERGDLEWFVPKTPITLR